MSEDFWMIAWNYVGVFLLSIVTYVKFLLGVPI